MQVWRNTSHLVMKQFQLHTWGIAGILLLPLVFLGCRNHVPPDPTLPPKPQVLIPAPQDVSSSPEVNLAGTWEYVDGNVVYCLTLNEEGEGEYNWQGGRFVTTSLREDQWQGRWVQTDNNREGRFQLRLSDNGNLAEGEWWYTRIEENDSPVQPGGEFALRHVPCSSESDTNIVSKLQF